MQNGCFALSKTIITKRTISGAAEDEQEQTEETEIALENQALGVVRLLLFLQCEE
jgi:hypothetical protein